MTTRRTAIWGMLFAGLAAALIGARAGWASAINQPGDDPARPALMRANKVIRASAGLAVSARSTRYS